MKTNQPQPKNHLRLLAAPLSAFLMLPVFAACSADTRSNNPPPPVDNTRGGYQQPYNAPPRNQPQVNRGLSNPQKIAILAGAAGLYYLYNQHKNSQGNGPEGQYYLSKNGRVYYRDAQHRAHWVSPPSQGIRVPESEAQRYREFQGYNNSPTGRSLENLGSDPVPSL